MRETQSTSSPAVATADAFRSSPASPNHAAMAARPGRPRKALRAAACARARAGPRQTLGTMSFDSRPFYLRLQAVQGRREDSLLARQRVDFARACGSARPPQDGLEGGSRVAPARWAVALEDPRIVRLSCSKQRRVVHVFALRILCPFLCSSRRSNRRTRKSSSRRSATDREEPAPHGGGKVAPVVAGALDAEGLEGSVEAVRRSAPAFLALHAEHLAAADSGSGQMRSAMSK